MKDELRETFGAMDPYRAQEIREAYYKAIEGLRTLAEMLSVQNPLPVRKRHREHGRLEMGQPAWPGLG